MPLKATMRAPRSLMVAFRGIRAAAGPAAVAAACVDDQIQVRSNPTKHSRRHFRLLIAQATTISASTSEIAACSIIVIFAQIRSGMTSVGLNAAAFVNEKYR